jgi:hypothetical protein
MENTSLHAQKMAILGRLIKESSLTLEETLLLLKEEQQPIVIQQPASPGTMPAPPLSPYWHQDYGLQIISTTSSGIGVINTTNSSNSVTYKQVDLESFIRDLQTD